MKANSDQKKKLWIALSNLFLDTELDDTAFCHIAGKIEESQLPLGEVTRILMEEVLPVCIPNLKCVAGEWSGFDEKWLIDSIIKLKKPNAIQRALYKKDFKMIKEDWEKVLEILSSNSKV